MLTNIRTHECDHDHVKTFKNAESNLLKMHNTLQRLYKLVKSQPEIFIQPSKIQNTLVESGEQGEVGLIFVFRFSFLVFRFSFFVSRFSFFDIRAESENPILIFKILF